MFFAECLIFYLNAASIRPSAIIWFESDDQVAVQLLPGDFFWFLFAYSICPHRFVQVRKTLISSEQYGFRTSDCNQNRKNRWFPKKSRVPEPIFINSRIRNRSNEIHLYFRFEEITEHSIKIGFFFINLINTNARLP